MKFIKVSQESIIEEEPETPKCIEYEFLENQINKFGGIIE